MGLVDYIGLLPPNQKVYFIHFQTGCLTLVPWGDEQYDCFVLNLSPLLHAGDIHRLALEIARGRNDWVQVLGAHCEAIHDAIDRASVEVGRQAAVGDGSPMTSWHTDKVTLQEMVDFVLRSSLGASDYLVVLLLGPDQEYSEALTLLRSQIGSRWKDFH
jgi:hypothetical protein